MIHPSAIIDPKAEIAPDVEIGPYTIVGRDVFIGSQTRIGSHVVIEPYVTIEGGCQIFQYAAIGAVPQSTKFKGEESYVKIGRGTIVREFCTIHRGTGFGGGITEIGEECFLMAYSHIAHDCKLGRQVIMANNATLGGHIEIGDYASIGGIVAIHQFVRIGAYSFIGGHSAVVKDVVPYVLASGNRATLHGLNSVGLKRHGLSPQALSALKRAYRILFRVGLTLNEALERLKAEVDQVPEVVHLVSFIKASERGITR